MVPQLSWDSHPSLLWSAGGLMWMKNEILFFSKGWPLNSGGGVWGMLASQRVGYFSCNHVFQNTQSIRILKRNILLFSHFLLEAKYIWRVNCTLKVHRAKVLFWHVLINPKEVPFCFLSEQGLLWKGYHAGLILAENTSHQLKTCHFLVNTITEQRVSLYTKQMFVINLFC